MASKMSQRSTSIRQPTQIGHVCKIKTRAKHSCDYIAACSTTSK